MMAPVAGSGSCPAWIARVSNSMRTMLDELRIQPPRQLAQRLRERHRLLPVLPPRAKHAELARLPVVHRLDTADDTVAAQDRQHVVAVFALRLRDVHLQPVAEPPQRLGPVAVGDEPVERREEGDAVAERRVRGLRVREPAAALLEPDTLRAEAPVVEDARRLAPAHRLALGIPALGEVPHPLPAAAPDDGDLSARVQHAEHQPHLALAPPAVRLAAAGAVVVDLAREERPALLQLAQDIAPERRVLLQVADEAAVERAGAPAHARPDQRQGPPPPAERRPLEELSLLPDEPIELPSFVLPEPAPQDEVLRRCDGCDRVELEEPEAAHGVKHVRRRAVEELSAHGDPARLLDGNLTRARHALARGCVPGARRPSRASSRRCRARSARA